MLVADSVIPAEVPAFPVVDPFEQDARSAAPRMATPIRARTWLTAQYDARHQEKVVEGTDVSPVAGFWPQVPGRAGGRNRRLLLVPEGEGSPAQEHWSGEAATEWVTRAAEVTSRTDIDC